MKRTVLLFLSIFCLTTAHSQVIVTVAGTGTLGYSGDGGLATSAMLAQPEGVALDPFGNLYVCVSKCVRKVSPALGGTITTFAGVATSAGYSGDGGPAYFARVNGVHDVATDKYGNVYLADAGNHRIRKVTLDGIINTIAGTGTPGYNGDGIAATSAQLYSPYGVAVDDTGNVFIADMHNRRIRKVSTMGTISTIAGNGMKGYSGDGGMADTATLHHPIALEFDKEGNLYIADSTRIRKINTAGVISTVAGIATFGFSGDGGPAIAAEVTPYAISLDTFGNLFIADDGRIRKVNTEGTISTIAGTGSPIYNGDGIHPLSANLWSPSGVVLNPAGDIFVGDKGNSRVRMITDAALGIDNTETEEQTIRIYPNPSSGNCKVTITTDISKHAYMAFTSMNGVEVYRQKIPTNRSVTISADLVPGIYLIRADVKGQHFSTILTVQ